MYSEVLNWFTRAVLPTPTDPHSATRYTFGIQVEVAQSSSAPPPSTLPDSLGTTGWCLSLWAACSGKLPSDARLVLLSRKVSPLLTIPFDVILKDRTRLSGSPWEFSLIASRSFTPVSGMLFRLGGSISFCTPRARGLFLKECVREGGADPLWNLTGLELASSIAAGVLSKRYCQRQIRSILHLVRNPTKSRLRKIKKSERIYQQHDFFLYTCIFEYWSVSFGR